MFLKDILIYALIILFSSLSPAVFGLQPKPLELSVGLSKPPFVIENDKQGHGIQLDLIREIFATDNQDVNFMHIPLVRSFAAVDKWHFDGTITLPSDYKAENVFVSSPYVSYQNVIVTLAEDNLSINTVADLANKNVIAFQTARYFLGKEFSEVVVKAQEYREMADQMKQIEMLFLKRTQVLILDISILKHFLNNQKSEKYNTAYKIHFLFPKSVYSAGFKNRFTRDQFNRGLKIIKDNGKYQQILDKYLL